MYDLINLDLLHTIIGENKKEAQKDVLMPLERMCLRGYSLDFRLLMHAERPPVSRNKNKIDYFNGDMGSLTGGDFINDLCKLTPADFKAPTHKHKQEFKELLKTAQTFKSKKYFNKLGAKLEAQLFHKSRKPIKKVLKTSSVDSAFGKITMNRYSDIDKPDLKSMASCVEEFATVIDNFYKCVPLARNYYPLYRGTNLNEYVKNFFTLFSIEQEQKEMEKKVAVYKSVLPTGLKIAEWT